MLSVEKVYDELYGMIEDLKKKIAALSSGDEVTITPALEEGTKIADYTIGETVGSLYAPTSIDFSTTEQATGVKWIDGSDVYVKTYSNITVTQGDTTIEADTAVEHILYFIKSMCGGVAGEIAGDSLYVNNSGELVYYIDTVSSIMSSGVDFIVYYTKATSPEPEENTKNRRKK